MQRFFEICFTAVVMVFGGVSLSTNQRLKSGTKIDVFDIVAIRAPKI